VRCAGIKADGGRCKAQAMRNSQWCINHDPDQAETRRRRASKGGKRGGRGRPVAELARLDKQLEDLAADALQGSVERGVAAVVNQIINTRARLIELERKIREQEELEERLEALESVLKVRRAT
jgi:hypothetical protein